MAMGLAVRFDLDPLLFYILIHFLFLEYGGFKIEKRFYSE